MKASQDAVSPTATDHPSAAAPGPSTEDPTQGESGGSAVDFDGAPPVAGKDRHGAASGPGEATAEASQPAGQESAPAEHVLAIEELQNELRQRDAQVDAVRGQYKEALDEFARVKARLTRDVGKEIAAGKRAMLVPLLDVLDNLERALEAAEGDEQQAQTPLCQGVQMVRDQFRAKLNALGVVKVVALGQPFNPAHFEAISTVPVANKEEDGLVMGVMREAYTLEHETLRHGMVAVGQHTPANK